MIPAFAQVQEYGTSYQPIRKVDLGAASLTLEVGEKYTFSVSFDPESPPVTQLIWFNTDNTVVAVNQLTGTVTALAPGTAWVMAESFDKEAWAVCEITVSGNQEKDLSGMVEGKTLLTLSASDRAKIKASQINRYLDLMEISVFNQETIQKLHDQSMRGMAEVRPGTSMATPMVSGSLALLMEAFPDLDLWEYKTKLIEMSTKTADKRDPNKTGIDQIREFDYTKPVLDFSNFKVPEPEQPEETEASRSMEFYQIADIFGLYGMPKTGFSALHPQNLTDQPLSVQYTPTRLTIQLPELDVRSDIVTVPFVGNEFPVEWLGDAVGMLECSSLPGEGITFLIGHNHLNTTDAGPFAFLFELEAGDRIMITGQQGIMQIWQVYGNMKVPLLYMRSGPER